MSAATAVRIDWRKLLVPSLFIMVLPTVAAMVLDKTLGTLPYITIAAIVICFPTATFWVIRLALQEMDRVIAAVTPQETPEAVEAAVSDPGVTDHVVSDPSLPVPVWQDSMHTEPAHIEPAPSVAESEIDSESSRHA